MRPGTLTALLASAVLGVVCGIGGALALDSGSAGLDRTSQDPLALGRTMVNQPCDDRFVIAIGKGDGGAALGSGLAANPAARYLDTQQSCETAWTQHDERTPRWVAYLGPYGSGQAACTARMTPTLKGSTVSRLVHGWADTVHCLCYLDYKTAPTLQVGMGHDIADVMWTYALQNLLVDMGRIPQESANGAYGPATAAQVRRIQRTHALPVTGVVDPDTWHAVQDGCRIYDEPSTNTSP